MLINGPPKARQGPFCHAAPPPNVPPATAPAVTVTVIKEGGQEEWPVGVKISKEAYSRQSRLRGLGIQLQTGP